MVHVEDMSEVKALLRPGFDVLSAAHLNCPGRNRLSRLSGARFLPVDFLSTVLEKLGIGKTLVTLSRRR